MANSRFEYVRKYELEDKLLPGCWIVVRLDGKGFTKFSSLHGFEKPNDRRALDLMDAAAVEVLKEYPDIVISYGESDEYSFVLHRDSILYDRRNSKLITVIVSCFTSNYVRLWPQYLKDISLQVSPVFDGRAICYPGNQTLRDYLSWRQADTHINNQYNTCFWALVKSGVSPTEAQNTLKGTDAAFKNELLFSKFGINYGALPEQFKKGSIVIRNRAKVIVKYKEDGTAVERDRFLIQVMHCDLIRDDFWVQHPDILK